MNSDTFYTRPHARTARHRRDVRRRRLNQIGKMLLVLSGLCVVIAVIFSLLGLMATTQAVTARWDKLATAYTLAAAALFLLRVAVSIVKTILKRRPPEPLEYDESADGRR